MFCQVLSKENLGVAEMQQNMQCPTFFQQLLGESQETLTRESFQFNARFNSCGPMPHFTTPKTILNANTNWSLNTFLLTLLQSLHADHIIMTWMVVSCIFTAASSIFSSIHRMKVLWDRRFRSWKLLQLVTLEARNAGSCLNFLSPNFTATTAVFNSDTGWRHPAERFALKKAGSKEHCEVMSLVVCGWWTTTCSVEATINW